MARSGSTENAIERPILGNAVGLNRNDELVLLNPTIRTQYDDPMTFPNGIDCETMARRLQIVSHRGIMPNFTLQGGGGTNYTLGEARYNIKMCDQPVADIRALLCGFYVQDSGNGEALIPNDVNVLLALEQVFANAAAPNLTVAGNKSIILKPGGPVITDPLGLTTAASEVLQVHVSANVTSTQRWPAASIGSGNTTSRYQSTLDNTNSQVGTVTAWAATSRTTGGAHFCPTAFLGIPRRPTVSVVIIGDSIMEQGIDGGDGNGNYGYVARGLWNVNGRTIPYMSLAKGGDAAFRYGAYADGGLRRLGLIQYGSHLVVNLGVNDLTGTFTPTQILDWLKFLWNAGKVRGKHVTQCLITPKTTSTDSWATVENQTHATYFDPGGRRDQLNALIRAEVGKGLLDAVFDPNVYCESPVAPGKWIATGAANYATSDGLHISTAMSAIVGAGFNTYAGGLTING